MVFIAFEKAFDSVNRDCIWQAEKIIAIVKPIYDGAKCSVLHKGKLSEPFEGYSGVRQGCILSVSYIVSYCTSCIIKKLSFRILPKKSIKP